MDLSVSTLTTVEELHCLRQEWLGLLGSIDADLPFLWPDWVASWWELFKQERPVIRDSLRVKVVRRESGELVAVVPLMVTERPAMGPARMRSISFLGADNYVTEQRAPIVDRAWESEVARALAADLDRERHWDWIAWEGLHPESDFAKTLGQMMDLRWEGHQPGNILQLAPSWDVFRRGLKHNIKESLRHCFNSLKRDGLTPQFDVAVTPEEISSALEIFFDLHAARAKAGDGVSHPDRFADSIARRFLMLVSSRFASGNMARVFTLRIGGVPVASRVGFLLPNCLYLYYSGFDPAWSKYSVGTTIVAEAVKYAIDSGISRVHLSMGADVSKSRWGPEMPLYYRAVSVKPRLSSRAALGLYSWAQTGGMTHIKGLLGRRFD